MMSIILNTEFFLLVLFYGMTNINTVYDTRSIPNNTIEQGDDLCIYII